uniref:Uncharacterized protein n=1 Tax=Pararge aegeria TaxID=116150 RepID=S4PID1_9NEOP
MFHLVVNLDCQIIEHFTLNSTSKLHPHKKNSVQRLQTLQGCRYTFTKHYKFRTIKHSHTHNSFFFIQTIL